MASVLCFNLRRSMYALYVSLLILFCLVGILYGIDIVVSASSSYRKEAADPKDAYSPPLVKHNPAKHVRAIKKSNAKASVITAIAAFIIVGFGYAIFSLIRRKPIVPVIPEPIKTPEQILAEELQRRRKPPYLRKSTDKICTVVESKFGSISAVSLRGNRPTDEDALFVYASPADHPNIFLQALFDGHGDASVSQFCARNLLRHINPEKVVEGEPFTDAFFAMDQIVPLPTKVNVSGSTAVAITITPVDTFQQWLVRDRDILSHAPARQNTRYEEGVSVLTIPKKEANNYYKIQIGHLGDSAFYILKEDGNLLRLTEDHKPNKAEERQRIEAAGGFIVEGVDGRPSRINGSLAVSRAFGDHRFKVGSEDKTKTLVVAEAAVRTVYATSGDILLLACDGLEESLTLNDIRDIMYNNRNEPAETISIKLINEAYAKGSNDNISAIATKVLPYNTEHKTTYRFYAVHPPDQSDIEKGITENVIIPITGLRDYKGGSVLLFDVEGGNDD